MSHQSLKVLFVCLAAIVITNAASTDWNDGRIVGGQETTINYARFVVQLRQNGGHFCGGTLIEPRYVVTAAHCLAHRNATKITVVGGATSRSEEGVQRKVISAFIPTGFNVAAILDLDIALLKLESDMVGPNIITAPRCTKQMEEGDMMTLYGWGRTSEKGPISENLRTVSVPNISKQQCKDIIDFTNITSSMVCAFGNGLDSCTGDSGGPGVNDEGELCAVISWGIGCAGPKFPGVYTGVAESKTILDDALSKLKAQPE